ncbi:MAG TPA: hypothetical protein VG055_16425 [Planctomycetaceae bacterium]|jgi:hypothetical protein|nr:hypothetical protein [Planctomycetaceae bacterium]
MNDNVIENLIARLPRPTPSQELDSRIAEITNQASPERKFFQVRRVLLLVSTAACAGLLGFVLGRQSGSTVVKNEVAAAPAVAIASLSPPAETAERVHILRAEGDALVKFVMPPKKFVGLFGSGRLETRDFRSQLQ